MILLLFYFSQYFGVILMGWRLLDRGSLFERGVNYNIYGNLFSQLNDSSTA